MAHAKKQFKISLNSGLYTDATYVQFKYCSFEALEKMQLKKV